MSRWSFLYVQRHRREELALASGERRVTLSPQLILFVGTVRHLSGPPRSAN